MKHRVRTVVHKQIRKTNFTMIACLIYCSVIAGTKMEGNAKEVRNNQKIKWPSILISSTRKPENQFAILDVSVTN